MFYPSVDVNSSFIAGLKPVSNKAYKFSLGIIAVLLQLLFNVTGKETLSNADPLSVQPFFQYRFGKNFVIRLTNTNKGCLGAKVLTMSTYLAAYVGESMTWIYAPVLMLFPIFTVFRIRVTSVIKVVTVILVHPDFHWKCSLI